MPLITIKPPRRPLTTDDLHSSPPPSTSVGEPREESPEPPPASPLTPVLRATNITSGFQSAPVHAPTPADACRQFSPSTIPTASTTTTNITHQNEKSFMPPVQLIDRPPPLPFSGADSTDAIALRAAISSLQFQRAKAQNDLRTLEEIKKQAIERPEEFRQHVLTTSSKPTTGEKWEPPPDSDDSDSDGDNEMKQDAVAGADNNNGDWSSKRFPNDGEIPDSQQTRPTSSFSTSFDSKMASSSSQHKTNAATKGQAAISTTPFPAIPGPQDIVRCPPIEWAKYHILGESLDKMHTNQQLRPGDSAAAAGGGGGSSSLDRQESIIAGPYNPFVDRLASEESFTKETTTTSAATVAAGTGRKDSAAEQAGSSSSSSSAQKMKSGKASSAAAAAAAAL